MSQSKFIQFLRSKFPDLPITYRYQDGRHIAQVADEMTIVGNRVTQYLTVLWWSGHQSVVRVAK